MEKYKRDNLMAEIRSKQKTLKSDIDGKLRLSQDMNERLKEMEKERDKKNTELNELRSNQKNMKLEFDR